MNNSREWLQNRLHTIVLATDFHQNSRLALGYAARFAQFFKSKLTALHAFDFGPYSDVVETLDHVPSMERRNAQELLENFTSGAGHSDLISELVVVQGFVSSAIIKAVFERSVDLLVIGTEGVHKGLDHLLLGSNTEALMLGSPSLTLTVGPHVPAQAEENLACKRVIYIADFSVASTSAATFAHAFGEAFGVEVEIYQLASKASRDDAAQLKKRAAQYIDILHFVDPDLPQNWFDIKFQLSRVVSEKELLGMVSESDNLIVLGVQAASFLQRHLHSSLAYRILAIAGSPVLTVPAQR